MDPLFLAHFWGWLLVILAVLFLIRKQSYLDEIFKLVNDKGFMLLSGYLALLVGLVTVLWHNVWVYSWPVVVTVFGWLSLLKGVMRIGLPELTQKLLALFKKNAALSRSLLLVTGLLGVWLLWASY